MKFRSFFVSMGTRSRTWMRAALQRNRLEQEMEAELTSHLERLTEELIGRGFSREDAERRARIAIGSMQANKEGMRASLGLRWWDELGSDLRFGARILRKSPGFTAIAAGSLALGIGANTAIFTIAKQMLYDRLNVPHPEQLRLLRWTADDKTVELDSWGGVNMPAAGGGRTNLVFSYPVYRELQAHNSEMQDLFAFKEDTMNATVRGGARRVQVEMVSGNYYQQLGVRPQLGRTIEAADDAVPDSGAVAVISDSLWQREFARSPDAIGQTIKINDAVLTIVGVNPRGFGGVWNVQQPADVMVPLAMQPLIHPMTMEAQRQKSLDLLVDAGMWWLNVMGRAKPGVKDAVARAALDVQLNAAIRGSLMVKPSETVPHLVLDDGGRGLHFVSDWRYSKPIYVLLTLTGLVLLLACANIANLLLARGAQRQREMSVRLAMGAGRARILRQLLTEGLLLAGLGGLGGLLLGYLSRNAIPQLMTSSWEQSTAEVPFDWGVFSFTATVTLLTGILFSLAPAWLAARTEVGSTMKETAHGATRRRKGLTGKSLVGFQIALCTLLVVGAGLFLRTLFALNAIDVGFHADHLLLFEINPPAKRYAGVKSVQLLTRLEQAFAAAPGVESVSLMAEPLLAGTVSNTDFFIEGANANQSEPQAVDKNDVGAGFFRTMGIPMLAGRAFSAQDTRSAPLVAVINKSLARKSFARVSPVGKRIRFGETERNEWIQIVGVCADTRYDKLRSDPPPQIFLPYTQRPFEGRMTYAVRTGMEAATLVPSLRGVVQGMDADLPMVGIRTQDEQIDANMQTERTFAALTAGFGLLALVLACVGIYGIMAYSVANRRNEIGIRMALGARPAQVRGMILRESTGIAAAGIAVGLGAALMLTRLVQSLLYGIRPSDPATMGAGALILLVVALAASWIPARRAARLQPMDALRHE